MITKTQKAGVAWLRQNFTYQQIGDMIGINRGIVYKILKHGYYSPKAQHYFGLPPRSVTVLSCTCGEVHTTKHCPYKVAKRKQYKVAFTFDTKEEQQHCIQSLFSLGTNRRDQMSEILNHIEGSNENIT